MKVTFSNLNQRWQIDCTGGVKAYVEGAENAQEAWVTVSYLAQRLQGSERCGIDAVMSGACAAAIIGNVVFIRTFTT